MKFIFGLFIIGVIASGLYLWQKGNRVPQTGTQDESIVETQDSVPLSTGEDIIRAFFALINEKRIPEAIGMMDDKLAGDDSEKQTWGVQFDSLKSITVKGIEPSIKEELTREMETFQVNVSLEVSGEAANAPIPYYGWENGDNTRWITLLKNEENLWKISSIATGP